MVTKSLIVCVLIVLLVGCAAPPTAAPTPTAPSASTVASRTGTIRISLTTLDTGDIPTMMVIDLLKSEGYDVQPIEFADTEVETAALAGGQIDIGRVSTVTHWAAVAKGAKILTVMEMSANDWYLLAKPEIKSCADLQGHSVGVTSTGSLSAALLKAYIQQNCPGTTTNTLVISNSETRATAMLANQMDASLLKMGDAVRLQRKAPGRFPTLANFSQDLRALKVSGVFTNADFASQHPDRVKDVIRAYLTIHRQIRQDPSQVSRQLMERMNLDADTAGALAQSYQAQNIWDVNGGMTMQDIQYSLDFFTHSGSLPPGLKPQDVADLSYLDAVLADMGRQ